MKSIQMSALAIASLLAMVEGCAVEPGAEEASAESDIVGVTDLTKLESAFHLKKDAEVNGKWARSEETLKAGGCYTAKLGKGAKDPANWQFRRYTNGAAFFRKANSGANSGDKRPIACVDIEVEGQSVMLDGFALDSALRFHVGAPLGYDDGPARTYLQFENGDLELRAAADVCAFEDENVFDAVYPGLKAYNDEKATCLASGKGEKACEASADNACKWWSTVDVKADLLERPSWNGNYILGIENRTELAPEVMMLAYRYALAKGTQSDIFSLGDDPVGGFKSTESRDVKAYASWVVAHYEHLDVHRIIKGKDEGLYVTPKSSDAKVEASAIVACHREAYTPFSKFTCKGL